MHNLRVAYFSGRIAVHTQLQMLCLHMCACVCVCSLSLSRVSVCCVLHFRHIKYAKQCKLSRWPAKTLARPEKLILFLDAEREFLAHQIFGCIFGF